MSEKIWSPGLPDIGARKSWNFLILTVSASTVGSLLLTFYLWLMKFILLTFHFRLLSFVSLFLLLTSYLDILFFISNLRLLTSLFWLPKSDLTFPSFEYWPFGFQLQILILTSNFSLPIYVFLLAISDFLLPTSDFWLFTSDFVLLTSQFPILHIVTHSYF